MDSSAGGLALLAESPELVGAEPYILANCRTLEVARSFLNLSPGISLEPQISGYPRPPNWWCFGLVASGVDPSNHQVEDT